MSSELLFWTLAGVPALIAYADAKLHLSKDLGALSRAEKGEQNWAHARQRDEASGFFLFQASASKWGDSLCIWSRQGEYTWKQAYQRACQYGHYFQKLGVQPYEHVVVYMHNSPEMMLIWMGLLSIGAAPALVNFNLASDALVHCVGLAGSRVLVLDSTPDCRSRIQGVEKRLRDLGVEVQELSDELQAKISSYPSVRPATTCFRNGQDVLPLALMYTSGTTGLPKAVPLTVDRNYPSASVFPKTFGQRSGKHGDRTYYCVPLYHGTGGIAAMNDLMSGISIAVAPKFSLSRFWDDIIDSRSTVFLYVGELLRYLLSAPISPKEKQHQVRLVWGNGLSPELWTRFQERFGISDIGEFYASTEGLLTLVKHYRPGGFGIGAIGHHGWLMRNKTRASLVPVRTDAETGQIWRSPQTSFAERLPYDQGGEILVKLPSRTAWRGYWRAEEATEKKLVQNVFEAGDLYFRTGDALRRDVDGHWYFMDRLGDTYRWKGENVSTTEVCQVLCADAAIAEANTYGVKVPGHDGSAGCAAIVLHGQVDSFDWQRLAERLRAELPIYAVPVFLRVRDEVGTMTTDNHKHNKVSLKQEGVDPGALGSKVQGGESDRLFWLPPKSRQYMPFTKRDWAALSGGQARL